MKRPLVWILALLIAAPLLAAPHRLGSDVVPQSQSIMLKLDPRADSYSGTVVIELAVKKESASFDLHAEEMKIEKVTIDGAEAAAKPGDNHLVTITPAAPLKAGKAQMTIEFSNEFDRRAVGLYKMVRKDEPYLFTQFQAIDARKAFPCWDEPGFKIPYELTATVPSQYDALFNTPVADQSEADGWKTITFRKTPPLPSYLLAIAVGTFEYTPVAGTSIPTRVVTTKGQSGLTGVAVEQTPKVLAALEKYFGSKYPFEKLDLVAVPEFWAGAMENPGLITYAEGVLLVDPKAGTPAQRRSNARVTTHELAHMWFGDYVTMAWWDDLWLNESFADWIGDKITDEVFPEYGLALNELQSQQMIMNFDASPLTNAIRQKDVSPEESMRSVGIAYNKGKAVISMFEQWLGPEQFRAGVNRHLAAHAWGNASATDFWNAIGKQTAAPMDTFIAQPGLPLITAEVVAPDKVKLTQSRYLRHGVKADAQSWIVPVALRYSDGETVAQKTVLLDRPSKTFTLDGAKIGWVFPHANGVGYYRWRVPPEQFVELAGHASEGLSPSERIVFVGNLGALLDAGVIHGNEYLDVLQRFSNETDPEVLSALTNALVRVEMALGDDERPLFGAYVRKTVMPVLERIGYERKPGETQTLTMLRPRLLAWTGNLGADPKVIAFAKERAAKFLADPATVDPSIAGIVLSISAYNGGEAAMYDEIQKRFEAATVPSERSRYLGVLSAFRDPALRDKALAYGLSDKLRPNEIFTIPMSQMDSEAGRQKIFEWFMTNYDAIATKIPPPYRASFPRLAGGCSEARLAKAREFFFTPERKVEGMEREMERTEEEVKNCTAFRAREQETIRKYLAAVK
ncbi:MAG: M1 family metallopeptidase [Thermoanaerobaculia bacterium]